MLLFTLSIYLFKRYIIHLNLETDLGAEININTTNLFRVTFPGTLSFYKI